MPAPSGDESANSRVNGVPKILVAGRGEYERVRDLLTGEVRAEGSEIIELCIPIEELLFRFLRFGE